ncbi:MAG: type transport system permease protein [Blastococcus sp.]|jgi:ABC-2 type transport system permease protein|nr:type transport system permease protein [Blastococcus sp.]
MTGAGNPIPAHTSQETAMTQTLTRSPSIAPARPVARPSGASLPKLVGLETRKSLSTRSGKSLAVTSVLFAPAAMAVAAVATTEPIGLAAGPIAVVGMLTAFVLLSLGVLSTAGEWSHRTVQTTFLLVPHRGRVLAAKSIAVAIMGALFAAMSAALAAGVLALTMSDLSWDGTARALGTVAAAGAVFAVIGAGVGAALGNTPAALTSLYLVILGAMPVLETVKPALATKIDPAGAVIDLATGHAQTTPVLILTGWVVVSLAAGAVMTRRRAVQ